MKIGDKVTFLVGDREVTGEVYEVSEQLGLCWAVAPTGERVGLPLAATKPHSGWTKEAAEDGESQGEEDQ